MTVAAKRYLRQEKKLANDQKEERKLPKGWRKGRRVKYVNYVLISLGVLMFAAYQFGGDTDMPHPLQDVISRRLSTTSDVANSTEVDDPDWLMKIDYFSMEQKKNGAVILHIWCILTMFYGIAILCDNYFEPALECICESLNLKEDVAGATFMAAGGSAPELATSLLGVFVTYSDIGIGTIVGSAVFNVLFVIAICAILSPNLDLTWWPLARDCTFYCISILVLTFTILDNEINIQESIVLFGMYLLYVLIMAYNESAQKFVSHHIDHHELARRPYLCRVMATVTSSNMFEFLIYCTIILNLIVTIGWDSNEAIPDLINNICALIFILEWLAKTFALGFVGYWLDVMNAFDGILVMLIVVEFILQADDNLAGGVRGARMFRFFRVVRIIRVIRLYKTMYAVKCDAYTQTTPRLTGEPSDASKPDGITAPAGDTPPSGSEVESVGAAAAVPSSGGNPAKIVPVGSDDASANADKDFPGDAGGGDDDDDDDDGPFDPFEVPDDMLGKVVFALTIPMVVMMWMVIPDCQRDNRKKWYPLTFIACISTIAILAYVMVWMATLFGKVANIPDPVMGLTFLAAGTSIPDALSSLAVARKGFGDMAVSSSVGSNIFDILVGLPVPWFLKTAIEGGVVEIKSDGMAIMIITLFIMVALVVTSIRTFQWKLVKKLGYLYLFLYLLFVIMALLLEAGLLF